MAIDAKIHRLVENFDPWSIELANDAELFWAVINGIREHGPVLYSERHGGFWVIAGYDEVLRATKDWKTFSSAQGAAVPANPDLPKLAPIEVDPPDHSDWRRILNPLMSHAAVSRHESAMRRIASALMDEFIEVGECDLVKDFAERFVPGALFELMLGVPGDQLPTTHALVQSFISSAGRSSQQEAFTQLTMWAEQFLLWRKEQPERGDVTDALLRGDVRGVPLTMDQMVSTLVMLVLAGMETTASGISHIAQHLAFDPELCRDLASSKAQTDLVIDEIMRRESVSFGLARVTTRDVEIGGQLIPEGSRVFLLWAAANWDPNVFPTPERIDIRRPRNKHLAFGTGPHKCMGQHFAKLLLKVATTEIATRMPDLQLRPGAAAEHQPGLTRVTRSLPVLFRPTRRLGHPKVLTK
ncbi:cytochrome P450 [Nocardia sp. NPDC051052]|uniref:cytochrome P450 n=1 Tax=Nocardia sp. NPDC051052 TaxID=3364322 RepID=UPI0037AF9D18